MSAIDSEVYIYGAALPLSITLILVNGLSIFLYDLTRYSAGFSFVGLFWALSSILSIANNDTLQNIVHDLALVVSVVCIGLYIPLKFFFIFSPKVKKFVYFASIMLLIAAVLRIFTLYNDGSLLQAIGLVVLAIFLFCGGWVQVYSLRKIGSFISANPRLEQNQRQQRVRSIVQILGSFTLIFELSLIGCQSFPGIPVQLVRIVLLFAASAMSLSDLLLSCNKTLEEQELTIATLENINENQTRG